MMGVQCKTKTDREPGLHSRGFQISNCCSATPLSNSPGSTHAAREVAVSQKRLRSRGGGLPVIYRTSSWLKAVARVCCRRGAAAQELESWVVGAGLGCWLGPGVLGSTTVRGMWTGRWVTWVVCPRSRAPRVS